MNLSACSTSFNCVEAVEEHCRSIFCALGVMDYEYVVIDNRSDDGTYQRLHAISLENPRPKLLSRRCSRGRGRQYAVALASHDTIYSVDVDTVYRPELRSFVELYFKRFRPAGLAVQAVYAGLYPRELWFQAGGMHNLNFGEDFDLWMRIWHMGRMRWTPVVMGENRKPATEQDIGDVVSRRYRRRQRVWRLVRRELDFLCLRDYRQLDLDAVLRSGLVYLGLGEMQPAWFGEGELPSAHSWILHTARNIHDILADREVAQR